MASADVQISDRAIITALNTPGGGVYQWRDRVGERTKIAAIDLSPVNNPGNAMHRGGVVGTYRKSWDWNRRGSHGHHVIAVVLNSAPHAQIVEYGRSGSGQQQVFTWTEYPGIRVRVGGPGRIYPKRNIRGQFRRQGSSGAGRPKKIGERTGPRLGRHVLTRAVAIGLAGA
jgi:hypothetical protein